MLNMNFHIEIGNYQLMMVDSVKIKTSVEQLSDTATILLPGSVFNKYLEVESKIARGDKVLIKLGYDDNLVTEFEGYIESISTDDGAITLNCEDELFNYRVSLADVVLINKTAKAKGISVNEILTYVNTKIGKGFTLSCDYDFSYDKFVIRSTTGYDVLKKIQEEAKPNVYMKGTVLHVHPQYSEIFGTADYNFAVNIEKSDLKYKIESDRKYLVEVEGKGADGKTIKVEVGTTGGDKMKLKISGVSKKDSLLKMANEALKAKQYTGYEGSFDGWLVPYCNAGYKVSIYDADYPVKKGNYYVLAVETEFSQSGGKRKVTVGKKIS